ncbi:hypothetical protein BDV28DRAFT_151758 [Aspergillus coremiiformis]|uniref:Uncharacterized protein n=1 Tax=Aspergillus coremiiformis TaxID=138285 RepID=A0A5N6YXC7_9EURO|nr:hypothetical protein BDV28DRAFT_151758 [Aspergillus coremiiformis]
MKYDIQTLLALSRNACIEIGKFSDQALGNNLLRQNQAGTNALIEQPLNQSRKVSNISHRTETSSSHDTQHPTRLPKDPPPESSRAQTDVGFARFLKDHSSPKHQRVTAGGRIVPMEPQTPAPKMKLPVQKQHTGEHAIGTSRSLPEIERKSSSGNIPIEPMETNSNSSSASRNSVRPIGILPDLAKLSFTNGAFNHPLQGSGFPSNISWAAIPPGVILPSSVPLAFNNQQLPQLDQQPQMAYVPVFPDHTMFGLGSDIHTGFLNLYQTSTVQDPMSSIPTSRQPPSAVPTASSDFSSCSNAASAASSAFSQYHLGYDSCYPTFVPQTYPFVGGQFPAFKQPPVPLGQPQETPYLKCLDEARKQHESLSAQLARLDRYMAIHTWDIDTQSKKIMVEQRKSLVRELDVVRIYREQLELIFGKTNTSCSADQNDANLELRDPSGTYLSGNVASNQMFIGPMSLPSNAICAGQKLPPYLPPPTLPMIYPESEASMSVFPWQNLENPIFHETAIGVKGIPAKGTLRNFNFSQQRKAMETTPDLSQVYETHVHTSSSSDRSSSTGNRQASSRIPSPLDLRHLYRKIEEATKRGEPVDGLLKELSVVTTRLVNRRREESKLPHRPTPSKEGLPSLASGKMGSARITSSDRSLKHARQLWGPEAPPRRPVRSCDKTSSMSDVDGNEKLSSSYVSTTDSWATGNTHWVDTSSLEDDKHAKNSESIWASPQILPKYKLSSIEAQVSGALHNVGWIQNQLGDNGALKSNNTTTLHRSHRLRGRSTNVQSVKPPISPLNTQHLSKNGGLVFQKTAALAVPQNVNVQAYVPPFDGPGDAARDETSQCTMAQDSAQEGRPWYMPKQRVKPSRETVREFFRQVREEEKRDMHSSQNEARPNGTRATSGR